jgi:hypothetical protein
MKLRSNIFWKHRNVKGCKGKECCCKGRTIIHKSAIESTASHRGANNGRSTMKGNRDGVT